jgi:hypothetical protein
MCVKFRVGVGVEEEDFDTDVQGQRAHKRVANMQRESHRSSRGEAESEQKVLVKFREGAGKGRQRTQTNQGTEVRPHTATSCSRTTTSYCTIYSIQKPSEQPRCLLTNLCKSNKCRGRTTVISKAKGKGGVEDANGNI